jgi:hypothetical protein
VTGVRQEWAAWGDRVYGSDADWAASKRRYWDSRWTLFRRCLWCRSGRGLQLNHLTYVTTRIRRGWTPLWLFVPLCARCHHGETWLTRKIRKVWPWGEHVVATFGVYLLSRAVILYALWVMIGIVRARV